MMEYAFLIDFSPFCLIFDLVVLGVKVRGQTRNALTVGNITPSPLCHMSSGNEQQGRFKTPHSTDTHQYPPPPCAAINDAGYPRAERRWRRGRQEESERRWTEESSVSPRHPSRQCSFERDSVAATAVVAGSVLARRRRRTPGHRRRLRKPPRREQRRKRRHARPSRNRTRKK